LVITEDVLSFEQMVRPTVESGKNTHTDRAMRMQAQRPLK